MNGVGEILLKKQIKTRILLHGILFGVDVIAWDVFELVPIVYDFEETGFHVHHQGVGVELQTEINERFEKHGIP